jgi:hypothetical protein
MASPEHIMGNCWRVCCKVEMDGGHKCESMTIIRGQDKQQPLSWLTGTASCRAKPGRAGPRRALVKRSSQIRAAAEAWPATWKTLSLFQVNGSRAASPTPCPPPHRLQFVSGRELCNLLKNSCRLLLIFDSLTEIKIMAHLDDEGNKMEKKQSQRTQRIKSDICWLVSM